MENYLKQAISICEAKTQWASGENLWLDKFLSPPGEQCRCHQWQGVFLSHHRMDATIHLHVTRRTHFSAERPWSFPVAYLNIDRTAWIIHQGVNENYEKWLIRNEKSLQNIQRLKESIK